MTVVKLVTVVTVVTVVMVVTVVTKKFFFLPKKNFSHQKKINQKTFFLLDSLFTKKSRNLLTQKIMQPLHTINPEISQQENHANSQLKNLPKKIRQPE